MSGTFTTFANVNLIQTVFHLAHFYGTNGNAEIMANGFSHFKVVEHTRKVQHSLNAVLHSNIYKSYYLGFANTSDFFVLLRPEIGF